MANNREKKKIHFEAGGWAMVCLCVCPTPYSWILNIQLSTVILQKLTISSAGIGALDLKSQQASRLVSAGMPHRLGLSSL